MNNKRQSRSIALIAIIGASLLWSTAGISKPLVRQFDPFTVAFIRFLIASLIILPFALKEKINKKIKYLPILPITLLSTVNIIFFYLGLTTSTANAATIIYNLTPLIVALTAFRLIKEQIAAKKIVGILIGFFGTMIIAVLPIFEGKSPVSGDIRGNLFFIAAACSWAIYTIGSRQVIAKHGYSPLTVSSISIFNSTLVFGLITIFTWKSDYLSALTNPSMYLLFLHLGILVTVATYLLFQWGVKNSSASTASLSQYLQPIFAIIFNVIFLGEKLTFVFIIGGLLVFIGVIIATGTGVIAEINKLLRTVKS